MKTRKANIMIICVALVIIGLACRVAFAEKAPPKTREIMDQFLEQLTALKPFMVSEQKFVDPKNELEISQHLKQFTKAAKTAAHDPALNAENFKFSRAILEKHIADTERTFRLGNKYFARWQLASTASICMTCHTQMRSTDQTFENFVNHKVFKSEFDQAEFLFATRGFDKAFALYDKLITDYPKNDASPEEVERALERQLTYYTRLTRDLSGGLTKFKSYQSNTKLPEFIKRNLSAWVQQLEGLSKQKSLAPKSSKAEDILAFAKKNIKSKVAVFDSSNPKLVTYLYVSGILYEFLNKHPQSAAVPDVLYWLSFCDRSVNSSFFYSLADLYLRECVTNYPKSPIARKCYKEFEEATIFGFTGSAGTNVPPEVQADLDELKKLLDGKGAVERRTN